jgi:hypothetical protein
MVLTQGTQIWGFGFPCFLRGPARPTNNRGQARPQARRGMGAGIRFSRGGSSRIWTLVWVSWSVSGTGGLNLAGRLEIRSRGGPGPGENSPTSSIFGIALGAARDGATLRRNKQPGGGARVFRMSNLGVSTSRGIAAPRHIFRFRFPWSRAGHHAAGLWGPQVSVLGHGL